MEPLIGIYQIDSHKLPPPKTMAEIQALLLLAIASMRTFNKLLAAALSQPAPPV